MHSHQPSLPIPPGGPGYAEEAKDPEGEHHPLDCPGFRALKQDHEGNEANDRRPDSEGQEPHDLLLTANLLQKMVCARIDKLRWQDGFNALSRKAPPGRSRYGKSRRSSRPASARLAEAMRVAKATSSDMHVRPTGAHGQPRTGDSR